MTASDGGGDRGGLRFQGFQAYADDTPRAEGTPDADDGSDPYEADAFDDAPETGIDDDVGDGPTRRGVRRGLALAGLAILGVAMAAGIYLGRDPNAPASASPGITAGEPRMNVQVAAVTETLPPPPPAPSDRDEKLEVLSPQAPAPYPAARLPPARPIIPGPAGDRSLPPPLATSTAGPAATDAADITPAPPRNSFACADAPSQAMAMVCADRGLASLDRRMKQAYAGALDAGVEPGLLREDQDDWLDVREDAAHVSRDAVADLYRQRIGELRRVARHE